MWTITEPAGICTVPVVCEELERGVDEHPYLQAAQDMLDDEIPVATISDAVANGEAMVRDHLNQFDEVAENLDYEPDRIADVVEAQARAGLEVLVHLQ